MPQHSLESNSHSLDHFQQIKQEPTIPFIKEEVLTPTVLGEPKVNEAKGSGRGC